MWELASKLKSLELEQRLVKLSPSLMLLIAGSTNSTREISSMKYSLTNVTTDGWTAGENSDTPSSIIECGILCLKKGEECNAFLFQAEEGVCYFGKVILCIIWIQTD